MSRSKRNDRSSTQTSKASKKDIVLGEPNRSPRLRRLAVFALVFILAGTATWLSITFQGTAKEASGTATVPAALGRVALPVALFDDGKARHYEFNGGDAVIRYFVLKSADGVIRAAFDACDVCWPAGLGYYQEGDKMVCRNCGRRFASSSINEVSGGCNPAPLKRTIAGADVIIETADLLTGKTYFKPAGEV